MSSWVDLKLKKNKHLNLTNGIESLINSAFGEPLEGEDNEKGNF
jgi:hypothetical protein